MEPENELINIDYLTQLARLHLQDSEKEELKSRLANILNFFHQLKNVDVTGIEPMAHAFPIYNVWDEDEPTEPFSVEQALLNAPQKSHNQVLVPKVVE